MLIKCFNGISEKKKDYKLNNITYDSYDTYEEVFDRVRKHRNLAENYILFNSIKELGDYINRVNNLNSIL